MLSEGLQFLMGMVMPPCLENVSTWLKSTSIAMFNGTDSEKSQNRSPKFFGKWGQEIKRGGGPLNNFKIGSRQFLKNSW